MIFEPAWVDRRHHRHVWMMLVWALCAGFFAGGRAQGQSTQFTWTGFTGGVFDARLNVQNTSGSALVYDASLGHTIYNPPGGGTARALVIGNPGPAFSAGP